MAKSMTVGKRENEKKRIAKREEKLKKKENKKLSGSPHTFKGLYAGIYRADGLWKCMDNPGRNPDSAVPESIFTGIKGAGTELPDGER